MATTPLKYLHQYFTTTLNVGGGLDNSQTTGIIIQAVSGLDITKPGVACLTYADPINTSTAEWITYTSIDGSNELQGVTRATEGFGAKTHSNGATVAFPLSESHINNLNAMFDSTGLDNAQIATPASPDSGRNKLFFKTDDLPYALTSGGAEYVIGGSSSLSRQAIINGNFDVSQRATTFVAGANNDDVYTLDRWNLFSDGNDVLDVSQDAVTDLPGSNYAIKLDVETAKRAGIVQFLEAKDAQKFKGKSVSISFAVKSANISAIRATVLSWASTADAVTSDIVGTWGATPTWATNWADNATPADLTVTSSWTTVKVENIAIDEATVNNLALAIWLPNEETIGDIVYISQVQMNIGSVALPFQPKSFEEELRACQRYYWRHKAQSLYDTFCTGSAQSTTGLKFFIPFPTEMRTAPSIDVSSTASEFQVTDGGSSVALSAVPAIVGGTNSKIGTEITGTTASGLTAWRPYFLEAANTTSCYVGFSAEL